MMWKYRWFRICFLWALFWYLYFRDCFRPSICGSFIGWLWKKYYTR